MKITVNDQPEQFYLAFKKWMPAAGHEIKVGNYRFCAIPIGKTINISEVTSGAMLMRVPVNLVAFQLMSTKEGTIEHFYTIGESIKRIIKKHDFDTMIKEMQKKTYDLLGEMPSVEDIDVTEIEN
ncbi:hypothetical protein ACFSKI_19055 [Pseudogracilibacillus auburnensis]|uniref:Uncharacterized protein n=1 Tax=Pseudogracilibacillus auburnensis TaxID=1494959 RepID=A0A2V3W989_9BACI|nr:hypothetical protein [Pseudogracilibacillus auburnensis]MBO1005631.1 hypothetical protein [Pseudogracilibacillus auburnensis]PXW88795.1 hypothetical protein DFR56_103301 [Pseudogracilibacillus auburnensis]